MNNVRPEVQWFAKQMEAKLRANDHKLHWSKFPPDYLIHRLYQEAEELWRAIDQKKPAHEVIQEAADVANFAMMIADVAERWFPGEEDNHDEQDSQVDPEQVARGQDAAGQPGVGR